MTKVLVCGGRDYHDKDFLFSTLDAFHLEHKFTLLIQGGARGADNLVKIWAFYKKIPSLEFPANWVMYGKAAGQIRNQQMLVEGKPNLLIAFPGGIGTKNMIFQAKAASIPIYQISPNGEIT